MIGNILCLSLIHISMHRNFNFLRRGVNDRVEDIHHQRDLRMRLVPILDEENHICEIINLERCV